MRESAPSMSARAVAYDCAQASANRASAPIAPDVGSLCGEALARGLPYEAPAREAVYEPALIERARRAVRRSHRVGCYSLTHRPACRDVTSGYHRRNQRKRREPRERPLVRATTAPRFEDVPGKRRAQPHFSGSMKLVGSLRCRMVESKLSKWIDSVCWRLDLSARRFTRTREPRNFRGPHRGA